MKIKLMHMDADGILDGEMHVNPKHIVSVAMESDGESALMHLDAPTYIPDGRGGSILVYMTQEIDPASYERIVAWMEEREVKECYMR